MPNIGRRLMRLWIVGAVCWITYWTWTYSRQCWHANNGTLWCPLMNDTNSIAPTGYLHLVAVVLGPPLWTIIVGILAWWTLKGFQERAGK